ncbi:hypothetical protein J7T55_008660 [Diaporthe amygdali]|uniref:uncharacterized protein n=1 Tax=Phomopsis amygdali TaxID=1214568 RepID=UPI0022FDD989|nr:uncharacterized protein J7T55_008660 [Diaporthe amygdali]KAJ0121496.1 hypothetical protein J7T55_008660 [Diaporthe amygdali]
MVKIDDAKNDELEAGTLSTKRSVKVLLCTTFSGQTAGWGKSPAVTESLDPESRLGSSLYGLSSSVRKASKGSQDPFRRISKLEDHASLEPDRRDGKFLTPSSSGEGVERDLSLQAKPRDAAALDNHGGRSVGRSGRRRGTMRLGSGWQRMEAPPAEENRAAAT